MIVMLFILRVGLFNVLYLLTRIPKLQGQDIDLPEADSRNFSDCYQSELLSSCDDNHVILVNNLYYGAKLFDGTCSLIYTDTDPDSCCQLENDDCTWEPESRYFFERCSGLQECNSDVTIPNELSQEKCNTSYLIVTQYLHMDFFCVDRGRIGSICDTASASQVEGQLYYLQNRGYPNNISPADTSCACSVESDACDTTISVFVIHLELSNSSGTCDQTISINSTVDEIRFQCSDNNDYNMRTQTINATYITVMFENSALSNNGKFWIGFQGEDRLFIDCPPKSKRYCQPIITETISTTTPTPTTFPTTSIPTTILPSASTTTTSLTTSTSTTIPTTSTPTLTPTTTPPTTSTTTTIPTTSTPTTTQTTTSITTTTPTTSTPTTTRTTTSTPTTTLTTTSSPSTTLTTSTPTTSLIPTSSTTLPSSTSTLTTFTPTTNLATAFTITTTPTTPITTTSLTALTTVTNSTTATTTTNPTKSTTTTTLTALTTTTIPTLSTLSSTLTSTSFITTAMWKSPSTTTQTTATTTSIPTMSTTTNTPTASTSTANTITSTSNTSQIMSASTLAPSTFTSTTALTTSASSLTPTTSTTTDTPTTSSTSTTSTTFLTSTSMSVPTSLQSTSNDDSLKNEYIIAIVLGSILVVFIAIVIPVLFCCCGRGIKGSVKPSVETPAVPTNSNVPEKVEMLTVGKRNSPRNGASHAKHVNFSEKDRLIVPRSNRQFVISKNIDVGENSLNNAVNKKGNQLDNGISPGKHNYKRRRHIKRREATKSAKSNQTPSKYELSQLYLQKEGDTVRYKADNLVKAKANITNKKKQFAYEPTETTNEKTVETTHIPNTEERHKTLDITSVPEEEEGVVNIYPSLFEVSSLDTSFDSSSNGDIGQGALRVHNIWIGYEDIPK